MSPLTFLTHRVLPPQPQKILDTDLSAPECQENVKIYQVIGNILNDVEISYWG